MMRLSPGACIAPGVRLVRLLGKGGMGTVWAARQESSSRDVAVKFLLEGRDRRPSAHARFAFEALAPSLLSSPHIVEVFGRDVTADGTPYIVMELLQGEDLGAYLRRVVTLGPETVVALVRQIAHGLTVAHEQGIVHRDIKPSNIFLCACTCACDVADGGRGVFAKLLDFGIAKRTQLATSMGTSSNMTIGTPQYMSPEQLLGQRSVGPSADVWSLGVLVFRALTGRRPFQGDTLGAITWSILGAPSPRVSTFAPLLGRDVDEWFFRACAVQRDDRFRSANEAADALAQALHVAPRAERDARLPRPIVASDTTDATDRRAEDESSLSRPRTSSSWLVTKTDTPNERSPWRKVVVAAALVACSAAGAVFTAARVHGSYRAEALGSPTSVEAPECVADRSLPVLWSPVFIGRDMPLAPRASSSPSPSVSSSSAPARGRPPGAAPPVTVPSTAVPSVTPPASLSRPPDPFQMPGERF